MEITVLLVDDEKVTRESLREYVPWATLGIRTVLLASNGVEALRVAESRLPDILLTDVRMPKLDGIDLADRVRQMNPECRIVFLSGYADKEYLKRAIQLRAVDYIEKPVKIDEVARVLLGVVHEIRSSRSSSLPGVGTLLDTLRTALGPDGAGGSTNLPPEHSTDRSCYSVAVAPIVWNAMLPESERGMLRHEIVSLAKGFDLLDAGSAGVGFVDPGSLAIVVARHIEPSGAAASVLRDYAERLAALGRDRFSLSVAVAAPVSSISALAEAFESARSISRQSFYRASALLFEDEEQPQVLEIDATIYASLRDAIRVGDAERAVALVDAIALAAHDQEPRSIDSVRDAYFRAIECIPADDPPESSDTEHTYVWQEIQRRGSLDELAAYGRETIVGAIERMEAESAVHPKIREVQRYVQRSFADPGLSLQAIADHVGLSRTYLSTFFKQYTGTNLGDYLTEVRLCRAKALLRDPALRTYEVASSVGYPDANYFSALFRRHVGTTPSEYREGHHTQ